MQKRYKLRKMNQVAPCNVARTLHYYNEDYSYMLLTIAYCKLMSTQEMVQGQVICDEFFRIHSSRLKRVKDILWKFHCRIWKNILQIENVKKSPARRLQQWAYQHYRSNNVMKHLIFSVRNDISNAHHHD